MRFALCIAASLMLATACKWQNPDSMLPAAPDYADTSQWYVADRSAEADIFYIVSTETDDYVRGGLVRHFADTYDDSLRALLYGEMAGVDYLLADSLNFFAPYYRQCTMETFASDSLLAARTPTVCDDLRRAFRHYMDSLNDGRPFVLAGFSQGGLGVVELLEAMTDKDYSRMVAAYVIGWKVTDADLQTCPHIRAAHDSADLGVTVCYNSVRTPDCAVPIISEGNRITVNPLNWHTDGTPAQTVYKGDTLTVALDTASLLLCVDGYRRDDYMLPLIGVDGNYHCLDITLYSESLRRNIALRCKTFGGLSGQSGIQ